MLDVLVPRASSNRRQCAFTLIELLIVVAIIGILAAIAVPNFLNAQTRAKVARAESDLRSLQTGMAMYRLDNNAYPYPIARWMDDTAFELAPLTTPIAYMPSIPPDPFAHQFDRDDPSIRLHGGNYTYQNCLEEPWWCHGASSYTREKVDEGALYLLWSVGPDQIEAPMYQYHASNGLKSYGNIIVHGL